LALAGCAATPSSDPAAGATAAGSPGAFPRTVSVPAGDGRPAAEVRLEQEPQRVAALTYESAGVVAELGAADRLVLVPEAATNPVLSNHPGQMAAVEHHVPSESSIDAEAVIAAAPDLVLLNDRHGLEEGVGSVLEGAGIPVVGRPNTWSSVADMITSRHAVGGALGGGDVAAALGEQITGGFVDASAADGPGVLVLRTQAGRPFVTMGGVFPLESLRL